MADLARYGSDVGTEALPLCWDAGSRLAAVSCVQARDEQGLAIFEARRVDCVEQRFIHFD